MKAQIIKRDGSVVAFDEAKIIAAIERAGIETGEFSEVEARALADKVLAKIEKLSTDKLTVEMVQDIAEDVLLRSKFKKTAKAYIIYRDQHAKLRHITSQGYIDLVDQYLSKLDWKVKENSNMGYSLQGLNTYISSEASKTYWLDKIYTPAQGKAHKEGDLHIHDLNLLSVYCVGWDLMDLLREGFTGVAGKVSSKPASISAVLWVRW